LLAAGDQRRRDALVGDVDDDDRRDQDQRDDAEPDVGGQDRDDRVDQHGHGAERERERRHHEPHGLDVGVDVAQQLTGRVPSVPRQRQVGVLPVEPMPVVRV